MEWTQLLNQAIDYLEEHLTGEISGTEAASHVGLSAFHFQRAFSLMTGLTVSEYLRSRRLSLAGQDLLRGAKVLDTALKYGYETPGKLLQSLPALSRGGSFPGESSRNPAQVLSTPCG